MREVLWIPSAAEVSKLHDQLIECWVVHGLNVLLFIELRIDLLEQSLQLILADQVRECVMVLEQFGHLTKTDGLALLIVLVKVSHILGVETRIGVLVVEVSPQLGILLHH